VEEHEEEDPEEADEEVEGDSDDDSAEVGEDEDSEYDEEDEDEEDSDQDQDDEEEDKKPSRFKDVPRPLTLRRPAPPIGGLLRAAISFEDMRKLESALDDLAECRRLLEDALDEKL
jgi:hypothetical protein